MAHTKTFTPLESNPELFTELIHSLGMSPTLSFHDVLTLDDPSLLAFVPRPALALVLTLPTSPDYNERVARLNELSPEYEKRGDGEDVVWYRQTIHNACGLYAILHAMSNGPARDFVVPGSHFSRLLHRCIPLGCKDRASTIEADRELETAYNSVALRGDTDPPEDPGEEVDFHYICLVKSHKDSHLYLLDGDCSGPRDLGDMADREDMLSQRALDAVKEIVQTNGHDGHFNLLALAPGSLKS